MKKVKNYIDVELAKKKIARYRYWSIKDENGITIISVDDDNPENKSFSEVLDKIIADNVDAEVQIKYGTNEQSSRQNAPFFIRINEEIEWIEPEEDETVKINGIPHKLDKNGNVNINLTTSKREEPEIEVAHIDTFRHEMDMQLSGLRKEYELKEQKMQIELQNKLLEQTLKFKEMMLNERESKVAEREQNIVQQEAVLEEKEREMQEGVKSYVRQIPNALGGLIKEFIKDGSKKTLAGTSKERPEKPKPERREVEFSIERNEDDMELEPELPFENSDEDFEVEQQNHLETTKNTEEDEQLQSETDY